MKFPIPNYRAMLDSMARKKVFDTIDLQEGLLQNPLYPEVSKLTAFVTLHAVYE